MESSGLAAQPACSADYGASRDSDATFEVGNIFAQKYKLILSYLPIYAATIPRPTTPSLFLLDEGLPLQWIQAENVQRC
jgi:hypothetical protein